MKPFTKTLILWFVLIVLFVGFYAFFSGPRGDVPSSAPSESSPTSWVSWLVPVIFLAVFAYFLSVQKKVQASNEGVRLLNQGRYAQALEAFETYRKAQPKQPIGPYNIGVVKLSLWKCAEALRELETAQALAKGKVPALAPLLPEHFALTHALLGRLDDARTWVTRIPADKGDPGRKALAEAIVLARSGDFGGARQKLSHFEVKHLTGTMGALCRTLDAWCIERLTGELRHVDRVALFGETGPQALKAVWPELIDFVERAPAW